jgi:hypothetical protein
MLMFAYSEIYILDGNNYSIPVSQRLKRPRQPGLIDVEKRVAQPYQFSN